MNWRILLLKDNKRRREFYRSSEYKGRIPWRLKIGRDHLPGAIAKVSQQEQTEDRLLWIESANNWLKKRSFGFENQKSLSKDEIKQRKKELGELLTDYNRYYCGGDLIKF
jgi:hypothetical protein